MLGMCVCVCGGSVEWGGGGEQGSVGTWNAGPITHVPMREAYKCFRVSTDNECSRLHTR